MRVRALAALGVLVVLAISGSQAEAAVAPSRGRAQARSVRGRSLNKLTRFLRRRQVRKHLEERGMSRAEIEQRLDSLGDDELYDLSEKIDEAQAGRGDCEDLIIAALVARVLLIIIFLPFYIMWLMVCEAPCCGC